MVFSTNISESMEQIFTLDESDIVHVKFIDTVTYSEGYPVQNSFRFPKEWNVSNIFAYDILNNTHLNRTMYGLNSTEKITVWFPENRNNSYTFGLEFDYKNLKNNVNSLRYFGWSGGGAGYPISIRYTFKLPPLYILRLSNNTGNEVIKDNATILKSSGIAMSNESLFSWFYFGKVEPPLLRITKFPDLAQINERDPFKINVEITNFGGSLAENVSFTDNIPSLFKLESGQSNWFGNIDVGETEKITYILSGIVHSNNEPLGVAQVTYTDEWGSRTYNSVSNQPVVTIEDVVGAINIYGLDIPIFMRPQDIVFLFFSGYLVLFHLFVIRRKDYSSWNLMSSMDKVIYIIVSSIFNIIMTILIVLSLLLPFLYLLNLIPLALEEWVMYLFVLISVPFSSYTLDYCIGKFQKNKIEFVGSFLKFISKNMLKILLIYVLLMILVKIIRFLI